MKEYYKFEMEAEKDDKDNPHYEAYLKVINKYYKATLRQFQRDYKEQLGKIKLLISQSGLDQ